MMRVLAVMVVVVSLGCGGPEGDDAPRVGLDLRPRYGPQCRPQVCVTEDGTEYVFCQWDPSPCGTTP